MCTTAEPRPPSSSSPAAMGCCLKTVLVILTLMSVRAGRCAGPCTWRSSGWAPARVRTMRASVELVWCRLPPPGAARPPPRSLRAWGRQLGGCGVRQRVEWAPTSWAASVCRFSAGRAPGARCLGVARPRRAAGTPARWVWRGRALGLTLWGAPPSPSRAVFPLRAVGGRGGHAVHPAGQPLLDQLPARPDVSLHAMLHGCTQACSAAPSEQAAA